MSKKIALVLGSPRREGNTAIVAGALSKALIARGAEVTVIDAPRLDGIGKGCVSCYGCQKSRTFRCVLNDGVAEALEKLPEFDRIVLCAPVYFFGLCGQLQLFVDRFLSLVKYDGGKLTTPLAKCRIDLVATSGDPRATSGVENGVAQIRDMNAYLGLPAPEVLHFGECTPNPAELRNDPAVAAETEKFADKLLTNA